LLQKAIALLLIPSIALADPVQSQAHIPGGMLTLGALPSEPTDSRGGSSSPGPARAPQTPRPQSRPVDVRRMPDGLASVVHPAEVQLVPEGDPGSVRAGSNGSAAWRLFDANPRTALEAASGRPLRVRVRFAQPIWLDAVSVFGSEPGSLRVLIAGQPIPLAERDLAERDDVAGRNKATAQQAHSRATTEVVAWRRHQAQAPVWGQDFEVEWTPGTTTTPAEIAFWERGSAAELSLGHEPVERLHLGHLEGGTTAWSSRTQAIVSGALLGQPAVTFPVDLGDMGGVGRAFLVYELSGAPHFVAVGRSLNGVGVLGGHDKTGAGPGGLQVEEVPLAALHAGQNTVDFYPADVHVTGEYAISNVRLVTMPLVGVRRALGERSGPEHDTARGGRRELGFDDPVQVEELAFRLDAPAKGRLIVESVSGNSEGKRQEIDLAGLAPGWHRTFVSDAFGSSSKLRLRPSDASDDGSIGPIVVAGLRAPIANGQTIEVTYPLAGECFEGRAIIRGFVRGLTETRVRVGDEEVDVLRDGSFELVTDGSSEAPWNLNVGAWDAAGEKVERKIDLQPCLQEIGRPRLAGPVPDVGAPHSVVVGALGGVIEFGGARLEIPVGALDEPTRISVRPVPVAEVAEMDPGMVNVTPGGVAYRFGPHGLKFEAPIKISLPFDGAAMPPAATHRSVTGFYYDDVSARWQPVGRFSEAEGGRLVSLTDHFTDFVNATIATPDGPGMANNTPTSMKDMQLGSALAGVTTIAAPTASPGGGAATQYALELPPGRAGMQPHLALSYNSQGGSSWVGQGWDLGISKIELDTRYGVPEYDGGFVQPAPSAATGELSWRPGKLTYLLDGEQLTDADPSATGITKTYRRRVEGSFQRILRLPDPLTEGAYYFEVTAQDGTRFIYGRSADSRLADPLVPAHIFRWMLESVVDRFGNGIEYTYEPDSVLVGRPIGETEVHAVGLYPSRIDYTTHHGQDAGYYVNFHLLSDTVGGDPTPRTDGALDGRPGFLISDRYLLGSVEIGYQAAGTQVIRSYSLEYETGAFSKPLLSRIAHRGRAGTELYAHQFGYRQNTLDPFSPVVEWNEGSALTDFAGQARTSSYGDGWAATVSGGFSLFGFLNFNVAGGGGVMNSRVEGALRDLNGDGIADWVSPTLGTSLGALTYGDWGVQGTRDSTPGYGSVQLADFNEGDIGQTKSSEWHLSTGVDVAGLGVSGYLGRSWDEESRTLADMNGDGFPDLVRIGDESDRPILVRLNQAGRFYAEPILWGHMEPNIVIKPRQASGLLEEGGTGPSDDGWSDGIENTSYPVDPILAWVAPFSGTIEITGSVTRQYPEGSPVSAFVYDSSQSTPLWVERFTTNDTRSCTPSIESSNPETTQTCGNGITRTVQPGDAIYFRVSGEDKANKAGLLWSPHIEYTNSGVDPLKPYGASAYVYDLATDIRGAGGARRAFKATSPGRVEIRTHLTKPATPDEVRLSVFRLNAQNPQRPVRTLLQEWIVPAIAHQADYDVSDVDLAEAETLEFVAESDAVVDPDAIVWLAEVEYETYFRVDPQDPLAPKTPRDVQCGLSPYPAEAAAGVQRCTIDSDPMPERPLPYDLIVGPSDTNVYVPVFEEDEQEYVEAAGGQVFIQPITAQSHQGLLVCQTENALIGKSLDSGQPLPAIDLPSGAQISCINIGGPSRAVQVTGAVGGTQTLSVPSATPNEAFRDFTEDAFSTPTRWQAYLDLRSSLGGGYHRWFYGDWNGAVPFDPDQLLAKEIVAQPSGPNPNQQPKVGMPMGSPPGAPAAWGFRGAAGISAGLMVPGRAAAAGDAGQIQTLRSSHTWNYGIDVDLGVPEFGLAAADTTSDQDFVDVNGDGLADIVTAAGVRYNLGCQNALTSAAIVAGDPSGAPEDCVGGFSSLNPTFSEELAHSETRVIKAGIDPLGMVTAVTGIQDIGKHTDAKVRAFMGKANARAIFNGGFSLGLNYGQTSSHRTQADMNGDGLVDYVIWTPGSTHPRVRLNLGYSLTPEIEWDLELDPAKGEETYESIVVDTDGDDDGLAALLAPVATQFGHLNAVSVHAPTFSDTASASIGASAIGGFAGIGGGVSAGAVTSIRREMTALVDVTGDGMADYVQKLPKQGTMVVHPNLGERFGDAEVWSIPTWDTESSDTFGGVMNDVLTDAAYGQDAGVLDVLGFERSEDLQVTGQFQFCFLFCVGFAATYTDTHSYGEMGLDDINGDGFADFVIKRTGSEYVHTRLNQQVGSNLLETIEGPAGYKVTIGYGRDGNTVENPRNQFILASTTIEDGQANSYRSTFDYDLSGKYDRDEREFLGYATVTTTRADGSRIVSTFGNQTFYDKGLLQGSVLLDAEGRVYTESSFSYLEATEELVPLTGTHFPAEESRLTTHSEWESVVPGQPPTLSGQLTKRETRTWDPEHGNLASWTKFADSTSPAGSTNVDLTYTIDYQTFGSVDGMDPEALYAVRAADILAEDAPGTLLRHRSATFDPQTAAVVSVSDHVHGGTRPGGGTYQGEASTTTVMFRDEFGNVGRLVTPDGYYLDYEYDNATSTYVATTTDAFGLTATAETNPLFGLPDVVTDANGHKTSYAYDEFGRPSSVVGPKDQPVSGLPVVPTIVYAYALPGVTGGPLWAKTGHKDVARNRPSVPSSQHDYIETVAFVDALGRTLQTKKDILKDNPAAGTLAVGKTVSGKIVFDQLGRVVESGQVFFDQGPTTAFISQPAPVNPVRTTYDPLDRVTSVSMNVELPGGALSGAVIDPRNPPANQVTAVVTRTSFGVAPDAAGVTRLRARMTDPLGKSKELFRDLDGSIVQVTEHNTLAQGGATAIVTSYSYNAVDELLEVEDHAGNVTTSRYDTVGRMVALDSPDLGLTTWSYDLGGNMREKQTAALRAVNKKVLYEYDRNRLTRIDYPTSDDRTFQWGTPMHAGPAGGNAAGRITFETSEAGTRYLTYDELGNVASTTMEFERIREPHFGPYRARVDYEYDSFGRLLKNRFPGVVNIVNGGQYTVSANSEAVTYSYDQGGNLQAVFGQNRVVNPQHPSEAPHTDYLMHIGYDEFGQRTRQIAGNFVETRYSYQAASRRLERIDSTYRNDARRQAGLPARAMQKARYTYDAVGNITSIANTPDWTSQSSNVKVADTVQTFQYDDLYQLKAAAGTTRSEQNNQDRYALAMQYDALGNITLKDQVSYRQAWQNGAWRDEYPTFGKMYKAKYFYDGAQPHTPSQIIEAIPNENVDIGHGEYDFERDFLYDASGNQTQSLYRSSDRRDLEWNEDNQLKRVVKNSQELNFTLYDGEGNKAIHLHRVVGLEETAYLGPNLTLRDGRYLTKHVFAGSERISSKMDPDWFNEPPVIQFHSDHLGSTNYTTNNDQFLIQHDEYYPSGELWTDQTDSRYELARRYVFAGKEQDVHTGLIDFGARSYDARQGQWLSADPALPEYLAGDGTGGIHIPRNLDLYTYAWNNPLRMKDMDGRQAYPHTYWTPAEHAQAYCNNRGGCTEAEYLAEVNRWGEFQQVGQDIVLNASPQGKVSKTLYQAAKKTPWFKRAWQWLGRALFGAFRNHAKKLDDAADKGVDPGGPTASGAPSSHAPDVGGPISRGHAFKKHVLERGEFRDLGVDTPEEFAKHIGDVVADAKGADVKHLQRGRTAYWGEKTGTVVIHDPNTADQGTAFRPKAGRQYFEELE